MNAPAAASAWTLESLRADHAPALLDFERRNRAYFARTVPDRGDAYFASFADRHRALLAEQESGLSRFHVLVTRQGELAGRVNLVDIEDGGAELGYRIGESAAGRGLATAAVAEICRVARSAYGLSRLVAVTTLDNPGSMAVLRRNGFTQAETVTVDGRPGVRHERPLTPAD
ncbi:GNAT family N-acetyltransferase [Streptomyces flavotricini]|uniref:GNAT family N-acetyltransferase n=1 Tax=Streptomyces flavotricini TaxID=66888 RepID=A0ABS8EC73_9ACTN|nr:GNAT family N-acetyltransferase [Streptomyces flavotricini]MCC0098750.1 GNAT family N-acetyltransferase [Streptomyces flavotricini]